MEVQRISAEPEKIVIRQLDLHNGNANSLLSDNRALMRHSDGALHAALVEAMDDTPRLSLFGYQDPNGDWQRLAGPISSEKSRGDNDAATDSNQNGAYVAYVESIGEANAGYVSHIPDTFNDPSNVIVHGPLTPSGDIRNSFLQGSRGYNSIVYGWRDAATGSIYVGVSRDGQSFPPANLVVHDEGIVNGPATGIQGNYVLMVYQTTNREFAPSPAEKRSSGESYYAWCESGDGGETWTKPQGLLQGPKALPEAVAFAVDNGDLDRIEIPLSGASPAIPSLQVLAWATPLMAESRLFVLTSVTPDGTRAGTEWQGGNANVGVLAHKPIDVGGDWTPVLTNRSLFQQAGHGRPYTGRVGSQYKYSALPGTVVRAVAYVDKAPADSDLEDQVAVLVSTNTGDSFDYEAVFSASQLRLNPDADTVIMNSACCYVDANGEVWQDLLVGDLKRPEVILHAQVPIGVNVQGMDPTLSW